MHRFTIHLTASPPHHFTEVTEGFRRSHLLRRVVGDEVEFITIILFDSLEDVRALAGEDYERAIIPADRLPLLTHYDARAAHYEVISTVERSPA